MHKHAAWKIVATLAVALTALWRSGGSPCEAAEGQTELVVSRAVTCLQVQDREPVNIDTVFSSEVGKIFCYTHLKGAETPTEIEHVWLHEGEERARVTLSVRSPDWRTWSSKQLLPSWTGNWKIEVRSSDGALLSTLEFSVTQTEAGGAPAEGKE